MVCHNLIIVCTLHLNQFSDFCILNTYCIVYGVLVHIQGYMVITCYHFPSLSGGLQFVNSNIHGISGTVTLPDSRTIVVNNFNYDGLGVGK